jgi:FlaA1/EpsC-like NDP-sugar epimerase
MARVPDSPLEPRAPDLRTVNGLIRRIPPWRQELAILALDAACIVVAFYAAYFVRFEGVIPAEWLSQFFRCLPVLLLVRVPLHVLFGIHRWSFRLSGFHEAVRLVQASFMGTAVFVGVFYFAQRAVEDVSIGPPRSIVVLEFLVTTSVVGALRFSPRLASTWAVRRGPVPTLRTLVVGAGSAGELLLRDLYRSDEHPYRVVGFVDDDPSKRGMSIGGRPVLGALGDLRRLVMELGVQQLLFAVPRLPPGRLRVVLDSCADLRLNYKILPVSFAYLNDRVRASMLNDLAPDDLLPRRQIRFEKDEIRKLISGRRVLVTGAAGSIGGEVCRQVAELGPAHLILLDTNENDLYFLYRRLEARFPGVPLHPEVADVRDLTRLRTLARQYQPQDVFHAAAHKHVPLMECAPEEAIKTNVSGCRNVARITTEAGAERFVLISTDKAVEPASAMGASKRLAEYIVRDEAARSGAAFTVVRFGNVLGSAGSVVPLFKSQIATGGPVTVTHPDCRRYLMTIREAVGLVLLAGLHHPADLCILEMGESIRILDLARLMITMAGRVPEREIPIVFTGLRPGEKLDEELMTAEEREASRPFREMIRGIPTTAPSAHLMTEIAAVEALAATGDRESLRAALTLLLPSYQPSPAAADMAAAEVVVGLSAVEDVDGVSSALRLAGG